MSRGQDVSLVCLEIARNEFLQSKGEDGLRHKSGGIGHHSCAVCKINFLNEDKLNNHYNTLWHKEVCKKNQKFYLIFMCGISNSFKRFTILTLNFASTCHLHLLLKLILMLLFSWMIYIV